MSLIFYQECDGVKNTLNAPHKVVSFNSTVCTCGCGAAAATMKLPL